MTDELYHLWTGTFPEISGKSFSMICDYFGGAEAVFNESDEKLQDVLKPAHFRQLNIYRRENLIRGFAEELKRKEIAFTYPGHELYPERLLNIPDRPRLLFIMGQHTVLEELNAHPSLAVVGSRMATNYGISMCRRIVSHVAKEGVAIISGMAAGIDGVAHSTVLDHHDKVINALSEVSDSVALTVGVLGCGIDKIYPAENRKLFNRMYEQGVVISEYPPGTEPVRHHFPLRNRIISGLSDGVLVVEAKAKSGSLITADQALEQGKDVYAVPGRATDTGSLGCINLIKQGAACVTGAEDIMENMAGENKLFIGFFDKEKTEIKKEIAITAKNNKVQTLNEIIKKVGVTGKKTDNEIKAFREDLTEDEKLLLSFIKQEPVHMEELSAKTGFATGKLLDIVYGLEGRGIIMNVSGGYYTLV
ncbi:dNA protecting protein DprA [Coprococcus sp. CAG:782]|nr:dNA protecting protein DprA [Coprococcus sp. CAG:782]